MECKICGNWFTPPHYNSKCCSITCRKKARAITLKKYKDSGKRLESARRRYKSPSKKSADERYRKSEKGKKVSRKAAARYRARHPEYVKKTRKLQQERKDWLKPDVRARNRVATAKYKKTPKGRWQAKTYKYYLRNNESGKIDIKQWERKLIECEGRCMNCGTTENITIDHIIPLSRGGSNLIENLQPLCRSCNCSKGNR